MNSKEIAELRRRFRPDRHNITQICGCYVSQQHEIISEFRQSLGLMPAEEAEKFLALLKKSSPVARVGISLIFPLRPGRSWTVKSTAC